MSFTDTVLFIQFIAPELLGTIFIVGWPALYRNITDGLLKGLCIKLGLTGDLERKSLSVNSYHQDLNLATAAVLLLVANCLKFPVVVKLSTPEGEVPPASAGVLVLIALVAGGWGLYLHFTTRGLEYYDIDNPDPAARTAVSPLPPIPAKGKFRVAGPTARLVFWTRWVCSFAGLGLSIWMGWDAFA